MGTTKRFVAVLVVVAGLAACGSDSKPAAAPSSSRVPASTTNTSSAGSTYRTKAFAIPLSLRVPAPLKPVPDEDSAHFVTFIAFDDSRAIRILNPVNIYAPDAPTPSPVPADYLAYLMSLRAQGAKLTDRKRTTVDGHNATVLTEGATRSLDGTLGCQKPNLDSGKCFGIQPEFIARLAVIDTAKGPLLIWVRLNAHAHPGMATEAANFDKLLASVRFAS